MQIQARIMELTEEIGGENLVLLHGAAEADSASIAAETVTVGDPTFAGPLGGVPLGLCVYHILEPVIKAEVEPAVYDAQAAMMEMVLDVERITEEVAKMRTECSLWRME